MTPKTELYEPRPALKPSQARSHESQIAALIATFRAHRRFLLTSHARPDGDAIGSVLALAEVLDQLGCQVDIVLADPIPTTYSTLPNLDRIHHTASANDVDPDRNTPAILLECDGIDRTGLLGLEGRTLINIDHHASGRPFASINWIDEHACAVAAMVYRIAVAAKVDITPSMATALYAAILSDTGAFTYSSTTADTFALVHDLAATGPTPARSPATSTSPTLPARSVCLVLLSPTSSATATSPGPGSRAKIWIVSALWPRTAKASSTTSSASPALNRLSFCARSQASSASAFAAKESSMLPRLPSTSVAAAIAAPAAAPSTARWAWPPSESSPSYGQDSVSLVSLRKDTQR